MWNTNLVTKPTLLQVKHLPVVVEQWAGNGPPVVLLHAGVCDRRSWRDTAENLSNSHHVVTYDRRGFGESPVSPVPFRHVDDLIAVLEHISGDQPAQVVGSSMGGQIALDAAVLRPDLVGGLVLFAPAISGAPESEEFDPHTLELIDGLQVAEAAADLQEVNRLETWLWLDGPASSEGRVGGAIRYLVLAMNEIILGNDIPDAADDSGVSAWQQLEDLKIPITVTWGELDVPFVIDQCKQLVKRLPNARDQELPGVAHLPYLEDSARVADLIDAAVSSPGVDRENDSVEGQELHCKE